MSLATAAAVLAAVATYERQRGPIVVGTVAGDWGWCRPGALPTNVTRAEYLDRLANEAMDKGTGRVAVGASPAQSLGNIRTEYEGVVRGGKIELQDGELTEGARVQVRVKR